MSGADGSGMQILPDPELVDSLHSTLGRLEVALDAVDEGIVWVDEEGRISWCNSGYDRIVGRMRIESLGLDLAAEFPLAGPDGPLSREEHPVWRVLRAGGRLHEQFDRPDVEGGVVEVQATAVRAATGHHAVIVMRDVSERVSREREAARQAAYVEMLHEVAARANEANDLADALSYALRCVAEHAGWSFGQVWIPDAIGARVHVWDPVFSEDPEGFAGVRARSLELHLGPGQGLPGQVLEARAPVWIADVRSLTDARRRMSPVHGVRAAFGFPVLVRGKVRAVLEFFSTRVLPRDEVLLDLAREVGSQLARVFERADADQALRTANDELESHVLARTAELGEALALLEAERETSRMRERAIDASADGIIIFDANDALNPVQYVNAGFEALFGYGREDVLGQPWLLLLGPEPDTVVYDHICEKLTSGQRFPLEVEVPRPDASRFWVRASFTPVRDERGAVTQWVVVATDITRQKEVDRLKNELVSTVSHELRTPLGSLCGFAELLLAREHPPARQRQFLGIILEEGRRLGRLVDDFLDIQRIESGRQTYQMEPASLDDLAGQAVAAFGGMAGAQVELVPPCHPLAAVRADPARIRQVLANLLSNAVKFSKGAPVQVRFEARPGWVRVLVEDHGIGIPAEAQSRLFTRFFRVDNRDTRTIGGTGLGLALVKSLVDAHGGQVGVHSEVGVGSTFWFELPTGEPAEEFPELFGAEEAMA